MEVGAGSIVVVVVVIRTAVQEHPSWVATLTVPVPPEALKLLRKGAME